MGHQYDVTYRIFGTSTKRVERVNASNYNAATGTAMERCAQLRKNTGNDWRVGRVDPL